jgi:Na+-translocating ferredoxin:NAD+ oxidoreductase subunit G
MMKGTVWSAGLLLVLAGVCITVLTMVNGTTEPVIHRNGELTLKLTILDLFGIGCDPSDYDAVTKTYESRIAEETKDGLPLYRDTENGQVALRLSGKGFQSTITVLVALKDNVISGFRIVGQAETPGLGSRISDDMFQRQFIGKKVSGGIALVKNGHAGPAEFDAVSGATESSKALARILNAGFGSFFGIATAQKLPENLDAPTMAAVLGVLGISTASKDSAAVKAAFAERITKTEENGLVRFHDERSGATALVLSGQGFQNPIMLAVALTGDEISGFRVIRQEETAGIGTRITEDTFQRQFVGKKVSGGISLVQTGHAGPSEFDAITKATESSKAVGRIINGGLDAYFNRETTLPAPKSPEIERMLAVLNVLGIPCDANDTLAVKSTYNAHVAETTVRGRKVLRDTTGGATALSLSGKGFKDTITLLVALTDSSISGFAVTSQNETPGVGARIAEDSFQRQFMGKKVSNGITLVKTGHAGPSEFDALTGATVSSEAVARILNDGLAAFYGLKPEPPAAPPTGGDITMMEDVLGVLGVSFSAGDSAAVANTYREAVTETTENGFMLYHRKDSGLTALSLSGKGFQDTITVLVAVEGDTIAGFKVTRQHETAGLGARISEDAFRKQFIGMKVAKGITAVTTGKAGPNEFDAVSGATLSSNAVARILNEGLAFLFAGQAAPAAESPLTISQMGDILGVLGVSFAGGDSMAIADTYHTSVIESKTDGRRLYTGKDSGLTALSLSGKGFQDTITVLVTLRGDTIAGFKVTRQHETAGLGARIAGDDFQKQFVGKKVSNGIALVRNGKAGPTEFDALTGATISSTAVETILNEGLKPYFQNSR